jgi:hypothetical protein
VRGDLVQNKSVARSKIRLLYPAALTSSILTAMSNFLRALGLEVQAELDPEPPILMKNAPAHGKVATN